MSKEIRLKQAYLRKQNKLYCTTMSPVPFIEWPRNIFALKAIPSAVWRSSEFCCQVFPPQDGATRLSIMRTMIGNDGQWLDGITWDQLMRIKSDCGFRDYWAVEIFPPQDEVVNVANMRHLWVVSERPAFAWYRSMLAL